MPMPEKNVSDMKTTYFLCLCSFLYIHFHLAKLFFSHMVFYSNINVYPHLLVPCEFHCEFWQAYNSTTIHIMHIHKRIIWNDMLDTLKRWNYCIMHHSSNVEHLNMEDMEHGTCIENNVDNNIGTNNNKHSASSVIHHSCSCSMYNALIFPFTFQCFMFRNTIPSKYVGFDKLRNLVIQFIHCILCTIPTYYIFSSTFGATLFIFSFT